MVAFSTRWVDGSYVPPAACTCTHTLIIHYFCMHYPSPFCIRIRVLSVSSVSRPVVVLSCHLFASPMLGSGLPSLRQPLS
jgi:hypothetical protein